MMHFSPNLPIYHWPVLLFLLAASLLTGTTAQAQIGYQVALLNSATGEPRAAETVNVTLTITNAQNEQLYTATQRATTNDFGVLSLTVGNADTFKEADWNKLPFYIAATVDGTLIGKSQILNVPVAEYAKTAGPILTKEMLVGTWIFSETYGFVGEIYTDWNKYTFNNDGNFLSASYMSNRNSNKHGTYEIQGNKVYLYYDGDSNSISITSNLRVEIFEYIPSKNVLTWSDGGYTLIRQ